MGSTISTIDALIKHVDGGGLVIGVCGRGGGVWVVICGRHTCMIHKGKTNICSKDLGPSRRASENKISEVHLLFSAVTYLKRISRTINIREDIEIYEYEIRKSEKCSGWLKDF